MRKPFDLSLYLVLDPDLTCAYGLVETAVAAVAGGVTMVQLRDKAAPTARLVETGWALRQALAGSGVPLIVNDDVDAAVRIGADGVHLGQDDMNPAEARRRMGSQMILGLSVENAEQMAMVDPALVDYAGLSPILATTTKPDHQLPLGMDGLVRLVAASPVPTVAIGGLKVEHVAAVIAGGADGVAVVSAICGQPDPRAAAAAFAAAIKRARTLC